MVRGTGMNRRGGSRGSGRGRRSRLSPDRLEIKSQRRGFGGRRRNYDKNTQGDDTLRRGSKFSRRGGKRRNLTSNDLDRDLENYWKGKDQEKQDHFKTKLDEDLDSYFKGAGESN